MNGLALWRTLNCQSVLLTVGEDPSSGLAVAEDPRIGLAVAEDPVLVLRLQGTQVLRARSVESTTNLDSEMRRASE